MKSSKGNIFGVTCPLCGELTGEFLSQRPVTRNFDVFVGLRLRKQLSKQSICRWFETPSRSLWRHYNAHLMLTITIIERITVLFFVGFTLNRLKRCILFLTMKFVYSTFILSRLQLGITFWRNECEILSSSQNRITTNITFNVYFKKLELIKIDGVWWCT